MRSEVGFFFPPFLAPRPGQTLADIVLQRGAYVPPPPEYRKVNHLINLLVVISLLLGSATPGLAFGGVGQSRTASG
ncbi:MAG: hypothetical protein K1X65_20100, partial [Caldilineales bacterium]|nr:hypothetical protein [Caldilineales bacterium]